MRRRIFLHQKHYSAHSWLHRLYLNGGVIASLRSLLGPRLRQEPWWRKQNCRGQRNAKCARLRYLFSPILLYPLLRQIILVFRVSRPTSKSFRILVSFHIHPKALQNGQHVQWVQARDLLVHFGIRWGGSPRQNRVSPPFGNCSVNFRGSYNYSDQVSDAILDACLKEDPLSKARHALFRSSV